MRAGLRPEETFGLEVAGFDWQKGHIKIRRGWSKKGDPGQE